MHCSIPGGGPPWPARPPPAIPAFFALASLLARSLHTAPPSPPSSCPVLQFLALPCQPTCCLPTPLLAATPPSTLTHTLPRFAQAPRTHHNFVSFFPPTAVSTCMICLRLHAAATNSKILVARRQRKQAATRHSGDRANGYVQLATAGWQGMRVMQGSCNSERPTRKGASSKVGAGRPRGSPLPTRGRPQKGSRSARRSRGSWKARRRRPGSSSSTRPGTCARQRPVVGGGRRAKAIRQCMLLACAGAGSMSALQGWQ